jgi:hypothetical protein
MVALRRAVSAPESSSGTKLLLLLPRLLLRPLQQGQRGLQGAVVGRCRSFLRGEWEQLYNVPGLLDDRVRVQAVITDDRVRLDDTRLVKLGEFKKAVERLKMSMPASPYPRGASLTTGGVNVKTYEIYGFTYVIDVNTCHTPKDEGTHSQTLPNELIIVIIIIMRGAYDLCNNLHIPALMDEDTCIAIIVIIIAIPSLLYDRVTIYMFSLIDYN